jgi:hypothetical protein
VSVHSNLSNRSSSTLDSLTRSYGPNVTLSELSSITTQNVRTIQNGIIKGEYPIPSFKIGGKRVFRLVDVADYLDREFAAANPPKSDTKPGRSEKAEQIARQAAKANERAQ